MYSRCTSEVYFELFVLSEWSYTHTVETRRKTKINKLLSMVPAGTAMLSPWLREHGYSISLQQRYKETGWLEALGSGALKRADDEVDYLGAIFALQTQAQSSLHPGGRTALSLTGNAHHLEFSPNRISLFGQAHEKLPTWFQKADWGQVVSMHSTGFLPPNIGMQECEYKAFKVEVSGAVRALMECLYLAPKHQDLIECYELMESQNNLRPSQVQELLEACQSVKVKRLFLFMASKANLTWFHYLDLDKIDLGSGKRSIVSGGVYDSIFQIMVPKELADRDGSFHQRLRWRLGKV